MILYLLSFIFSFFQLTPEVQDILGVKGPLEFANTKFNLVLSGVPENGMLLHIYLPEGEDIVNFNEKLSLLVIRTNETTSEVVKKKLRELDERQKSDLNCKYEAKELPDNKGFMLESITTEKDNSRIVEAKYTVSRIKEVNVTSTETSVLIFSYSWRTYDEETSDLLNNITEFKTRYTKEISSFKLPKINLQKKAN